MSEYRDKAMVQGALASLRRYIRAMYFSVETPEIENEAIEEYFATEDTRALATFEKTVGAAAIRAIYQNPDIPDKQKAKVARRAAAELQDAFRGARLDYRYAAGKLGQGALAEAAYERKKAELKLVRKATQLDRVKKHVKAMGKKLTKTAVLAVVKEGIAQAGEYFGVPREAMKWVSMAAVVAADAIFPKKAREAIAAKARTMAQRAVATVVKVAERIKSNPVIKKAAETVKTFIAPVIAPVYEKVREVAHTVREKVSSAGRRCWARLKSVFA